jgi:hypothetical protein
MRPMGTAIESLGQLLLNASGRLVLRLSEVHRGWHIEEDPGGRAQGPQRRGGLDLPRSPGHLEASV